MGVRGARSTADEGRGRQEGRRQLTGLADVQVDVDEPAARLARQDADVLLPAVEMPGEVVFIQAEGLPSLDLDVLAAVPERNDAETALHDVPARRFDDGSPGHGAPTSSPSAVSSSSPRRMAAGISDQPRLLTASRRCRPATRRWPPSTSATVMGFSRPATALDFARAGMSSSRKARWRELMMMPSIGVERVSGGLALTAGPHAPGPPRPGLRLQLLRGRGLLLDPDQGRVEAATAPARRP